MKAENEDQEYCHIFGLVCLFFKKENANIITKTILNWCESENYNPLLFDKMVFEIRIKREIQNKTYFNFINVFLKDNLKEEHL